MKPSFLNGLGGAGGRLLLFAAAVAAVLLLSAVALLSVVPAAGYTRLELADAEAGRKIFTALLPDGREAVLKWRNSLFGLDVTEVLTARRGIMVLTRVTFAIPGGPPPPEVTPADLDDLYHTGGPFTVRALEKPIQQVTYRVSEIGNPNMRIGNRVVDFKKEVGFGGAIALSASPPSTLTVLRQY